MLTSKQLETRRKYIGGSDAGSILGVNPYSTRLKTYESKITKVTEEKSEDIHEAMIWGSVLESAIAKEFCNRIGIRFMKPTGPYYHNDFKFIGGMVDRLIVSENGKQTENLGILEVKNMSDGMFHYLETAGLDYSPWHYAQIQHYFLITGLTWGYLTYLVGGNKLMNSRIDRDDAYIDLMIIAEVDFWKDNVEKKVPPGPETSDDLDRLFKRAKAKEIKANETILKDYKELVRIRAEVKKLTEDLDRQKNRMKIVLQESNLLTYEGKSLVTWNNLETTRVDVEKLKTKFPRVYEECKKTTPGRRLYIYG